MATLFDSDHTQFFRLDTLGNITDYSLYVLPSDKGIPSTIENSTSELGSYRDQDSNPMVILDWEAGLALAMKPSSGSWVDNPVLELAMKFPASQVQAYFPDITPSYDWQVWTP